jgi:hypothetical protein
MSSLVGENLVVDNSVVCASVDNVLLHSDLVTPYLIVDYNQFSDVIKKAVAKHFHVVDPIGHIFKHPIISYRRAENLADILVNVKRDMSSAPTSEVFGQKPCGGPRCRLCVQLPHISIISFPNRTFKWTIKKLVDCNAKNCVYLAVCEKCDVRYVGESFDFRHRMNNHNSQQFTLPSTAFFRHRLGTDHYFRDFKLYILRSNLRDKDEMRRWERFFIHRFRTLDPLGLNRLEEL